MPKFFSKWKKDGWLWSIPTLLVQIKLFWSENQYLWGKWNYWVENRRIYSGVKFKFNEWITSFMTKKPKEKGQKMCWFRGSYQRPLHRIKLRIVVPAFLLSTHRTIGYIEYQNPNCPIFQFSAHQKTFQKAKS